MLGGFKWHSNGGGQWGGWGRLRGGLMTQVSHGSHCFTRGTHKNPSLGLCPSPLAIHLLLELQGSVLIFSLELDLDTHSFFFLTCLLVKFL